MSPQPHCLAVMDSWIVARLHGQLPAEERVVLMEIAAEAYHGLRVELVDTGFGDFEDGPDFFESQAFVVVKRDYQPLALRQPVDGHDEHALHLPKLQLAG